MATRSVFLPGESHGQRSLAGYSPWGCKESDMTEMTKHSHVWNQNNCLICSSLFLRIAHVNLWAVIPIHLHCCFVFCSLSVAGLIYPSSVDGHFPRPICPPPTHRSNRAVLLTVTGIPNQMDIVFFFFLIASQWVSPFLVFNFIEFYFKKLQKMFLAILDLCCCVRAFSSCEQGLFSSCGVRASHWGGFSYGRAWTLGLSCCLACGIFLDQGLNPWPLHWRVDS